MNERGCDNGVNDYNNNITHPQNRFNNIVKSQGGVGKYKKVTTSTNYLKTVLNPY